MAAMPTQPRPRRSLRAGPVLRGALALGVGAIAASCGPRRPAVLGPIAEAPAVADGLERSSGLVEPVRVRFRWTLNEAGSRIDGQGVARVEPPYRARLDLFLNNGESVLSAALVDHDLRLPYGSRRDILPPVDLLWATLGVFRPVPGARLVAGERLEGEARRLRYRQEDGTELHYEIFDGALRAVELLEGESVLEWVRVGRVDGERYPGEVTYRNLREFRELKISRETLDRVESFDPSIWDPRE